MSNTQSSKSTRCGECDEATHAIWCSLSTEPAYAAPSGSSWTAIMADGCKVTLSYSASASESFVRNNFERRLRGIGEFRSVITIERS